MHGEIVDQIREHTRGPPDQKVFGQEVYAMETFYSPYFDSFSLQLLSLPSSHLVGPSIRPQPPCVEARLAVVRQGSVMDVLHHLLSSQLSHAKPQSGPHPIHVSLLIPR